MKVKLNQGMSNPPLFFLRAWPRGGYNQIKALNLDEIMFYRDAFF